MEGHRGDGKGWVLGSGEIPAASAGMTERGAGMVEHVEMYDRALAEQG